MVNYIAPFDLMQLDPEPKVNSPHGVLIVDNDQVDNDDDDKWTKIYHPDFENDYRSEIKIGPTMMLDTKKRFQRIMAKNLHSCKNIAHGNNIYFKVYS